MSRREEPGVALLSAGRAARDWKPHKGDRLSAGQIDEHDSRRQGDGRRGGGGARDVWACVALASCRLAELPCLGCKWAGPVK